MQIISARDIASRVKTRRKEIGWTQAQLAERSGVSRDWIIALEQAKPSVELALVLRTLKTLNIQLHTSEKDATENKLIYSGNSIEDAKAAALRHGNLRNRNTHGKA